MDKKDIYKKGLDLGLNLNIIEQILLKITGLTKSQLFLVDKINDKFIKKIKNNFIKYKKTKKIEYVTNKADFFSLDFYIDDRVLIPRNETELLVEKTLKYIKNNNLKNICLIDVGTGSGCIAISINKNIQTSKTYALDFSNKALEVLNININKHKLKDKIKILRSNLLEKIFLIKQDLNKYNNIIITANLPYIKDNDLDNMDLEVIKSEPNIALFGGKQTGFELYEKLINECKILYDMIRKDIVLFIEIGFDQKEIAENYIKQLGFSYKFFKDNSQIYRTILILIN